MNKTKTKTKTKTRAKTPTTKKNPYSLNICEKHTGKMRGMISLSTSTLQNDFCKARAQNKKSVCHYCYAQKQLKRFTWQEKSLEHNTKVLTESIIPKKFLPSFNVLYFRFESFGDLINNIQVENYFNICKNNKKTTFALWTKNPWIIKEALVNGAKKPKNLIIIYSSFLMNKEQNLIKKIYPFIDKIFTVYDKKTIKEKKIEINCGGRSCFSCLMCYKKTTGENIAEKLR